jgi:cyclopropane fatty-acyl-phospholipid synthase-like methyltransferase
MKPALKLVVKTISFQVPPRALIWLLLNKLHYLFGTGNRRFAIERLYLEHGIIWNYRSSPYERQKYEHTLACLLRGRRASASALEVGCSVGVFSKMLAAHFYKVTAIDISKEALRLAADYNRAEKNIGFVRSDLQSLSLGLRYDVIVCAEMLYFIPKEDVQKVCFNLDKHLNANGIIILVMGISSNEPAGHDTASWEQILAVHFQQVFRETVQDPRRPYHIAVFRPKPDRGSAG